MKLSSTEGESEQKRFPVNAKFKLLHFSVLTAILLTSADSEYGSGVLDSIPAHFQSETKLQFIFWSEGQFLPS